MRLNASQNGRKGKERLARQAIFLGTGSGSGSGSAGGASENRADEAAGHMGRGHCERAPQDDPPSPVGR